VRALIINTVGDAPRTDARYNTMTFDLEKYSIFEITFI